MMMQRRAPSPILLFSLATLITVSASARAQVTEYSDEAAFRAAAGAVTGVDFDAFPVETVLTGEEFLGLGLKVTHRDCHPLNVATYDPSSEHVINPGFFGSLPNAITSSVEYIAGVATFVPNRSDSMRFEFLTPTFAAGLYVGQLDGATGSDVSFVDTAGATLHALHLTPNGTGKFVGIVSTVPISAIETTEPAEDGDVIFYDNVIFGAPPVLCAKRRSNGTFATAIKLRTVCKLNETRLDLVALGLRAASLTPIMCGP